MPPANIKSAQVSPADPLINPIAKSEVSVDIPSNFNAAKGVASDIPSTFGSINGILKVEEEIVENLFSRNAGCQVVIATGNEACNTALPTKAGLKTLYPSPPNMNFPRAIAKIPPKNAIQRGKVGGRVKPNKIPDITADQSEIVDAFPELLHKKCSVRTADNVVVPINNKAFIPKL